MSDIDNKYLEIVTAMDLESQANEGWFIVCRSKLGLYSKEAHQKALIKRNMRYIQRLSSQDKALFDTVTRERFILKKVRYKKIQEAYNAIKIDASAPEAGEDKRRRYLEGVFLTDGSLLLDLPNHSEMGVPDYEL